MLSSSILPVLSLLLAQSLAQSELKGSLATCLKKSSNANLNQCLAELAEKLRPYMTEGLPQYNIPKTEPMYIDQIELKVVKPPIDLSVEFKDTFVHGLSSFVLNSVEADLATQTIETDISVPEMRSNGQYRMSGVAFITEVDSADSFKVEMKNANVKIKSKLTKRNNRLIIVDDPIIKVQSADLNVKFNNLFGEEGKQFAKIVHEFINQDSQRFIDDFAPQISKQVGTMAKGLYNSAVQEIDPAVFGLN